MTFVAFLEITKRLFAIKNHQKLSKDSDFTAENLELEKIYLSLHRKNDGAIAQLVEQRTENPCVPGSIPGGTTDKPQ